MPSYLMNACGPCYSTVETSTDKWTKGIVCGTRDPCTVGCLSWRLALAPGDMLPAKVHCNDGGYLCRVSGACIDLGLKKSANTCINGETSFCCLDSAIAIPPAQPVPKMHCAVLFAKIYPPPFQCAAPAPSGFSMFR